MQLSYVYSSLMDWKQGTLVTG